MRKARLFEFTPTLQPFLPQIHTVRMVHIQKLSRSTPDRSDADNLATTE